MVLELFSSSVVFIVQDHVNSVVPVASQIRRVPQNAHAAQLDMKVLILKMAAVSVT